MGKDDIPRSSANLSRQRYDLGGPTDANDVDDDEKSISLPRARAALASLNHIVGSEGSNSEASQ